MFSNKMLNLLLRRVFIISYSKEAYYSFSLDEPMKCLNVIELQIGKWGICRTY